MNSKNQPRGKANFSEKKNQFPRGDVNFSKRGELKTQEDQWCVQNVEHISEFPSRTNKNQSHDQIHTQGEAKFMRDTPNP